MNFRRTPLNEYRIECCEAEVKEKHRTKELINGALFIAGIIFLVFPFNFRRIIYEPGNYQVLKDNVACVAQ